MQANHNYEKHEISERAIFSKECKTFSDLGSEKMHRLYLKREMQLSMNGLLSRHFNGSTALVGLDPLSMSRILERIKTHHTLCMIPLGTSHGLVAETSNWQHATLSRDSHACAGGIRTRNPSKPAAADPCVRPCGHRDRPPSITALFKTGQLIENKTLKT